MSYINRHGLAPLEHKSESGADDPLQAIKTLGDTLESKFGMLDGELKKIRDRIDAEVAKLQRPNTETKSDADKEIEAKAFDTFVRKGREGMTADEVKSLRVSDDTAGGFLAETGVRPGFWVAGLLALTRGEC